MTQAHHRTPDDDVGDPEDIIRGLVLAAGGVTEAEATLLVAVLDRLERIEAVAGRPAAVAAARRVRQAWLSRV